MITSSSKEKDSVRSDEGLTFTTFDEYFNAHYPRLAAERAKMLERVPAESLKCLANPLSAEGDNRPQYLRDLPKSSEDYEKHAYTLATYNQLQKKEVQHTKLTGHENTTQSRAQQASIRTIETKLWARAESDPQQWWASNTKPAAVLLDPKLKSKDRAKARLSKLKARCSESKLCGCMRTTGIILAAPFLCIGWCVMQSGKCIWVLTSEAAKGVSACFMECVRHPCQISRRLCKAVGEGLLVVSCCLTCGACMGYVLP